MPIEPFYRSATWMNDPEYVRLVIQPFVGSDPATGEIKPTEAYSMRDELDEWKPDASVGVSADGNRRERRLRAAIRRRAVKRMRNQ